MLEIRRFLILYTVSLYETEEAHINMMIKDMISKTSNIYNVGMAMSAKVFIYLLYQPPNLRIYLTIQTT